MAAMHGDLATHDGSEVEDRVLQEALRALREYEPLRATRAPIDIAVSGGRVVLRGATRTEALRLIAGYLVSYVEGISAIDNQIVSDDQVVRAVADALAADPKTEPHIIQVSSRHGDVVLSGDVPDLETEQIATERASAVPIAASVRSNLSIVRPAESNTLGTGSKGE
jgi:osmotically-inducible protein OsmY